jgi:hypothetical protein
MNELCLWLASDYGQCRFASGQRVLAIIRYFINFIAKSITDEW